MGVETAPAPVTLSPQFSSEEFRRVEKWRVWGIAPEKDDDVRGLTQPGSVLLVLSVVLEPSVFQMLRL